MKWDKRQRTIPVPSIFRKFSTLQQPLPALVCNSHMSRPFSLTAAKWKIEFDKHFDCLILLRLRLIFVWPNMVDCDLAQRIRDDVYMLDVVENIHKRNASAQLSVFPFLICFPSLRVHTARTQTLQISFTLRVKIMYV